MAFAQNYVNLRYKQSLPLCTENAKKWIVFRATNITQEDVDVINAQTEIAHACVVDTMKNAGIEVGVKVDVEPLRRKLPTGVFHLV